MKKLTALTTAALCASAAGLVWFVFRIGPVLAIISANEDRALHLGDVLIGVPLAAVAVVAAVVGARQTRRGPG